MGRRKTSKAVACSHCGKAFEMQPASLARCKTPPCCSRRCSFASKPHRPQSPTREMICVVCGSRFVVKEWIVERSNGGRACSRSCTARLVQNRFGGKWHDPTTHGRSGTRGYKSEKRHRRRAQIAATGGHFTQDNIDQIYKRQRGRCVYCKVALRHRYHVDHIRPLVRGGTSWPSNLQLLCRSCNLSKGTRQPEVYARARGLLL